MPRLLVAVLAAVLAVPASVGQEAHFQTVCTLYDHDGEAVSGPLQEIQLASFDGEATRVMTESATATFVVDYSSSFTAQARAAFQRAVDIWADHLTSSVPIRVKADFAPLGTNTLGSAGPNVTANFPNRPRANTWYPFALADALAGQDLSPDPGNDFYYDIVAQFSSTNNSFYFGLDGNPPANQFDFTTIVLHELGHGLGFVGSGKVDNGSGADECTGTAGQGCWGFFDGEFFQFPFIFDRFLDDTNGVPMLNQATYGNPSNALGNLLQSRMLFMDSPEVVRLYGEPAPVWAPTPFNEGSSFSHWDEVVVTGTSAALMTPQVARGEAYQDPGDITCAFMSDIGWPLGSGCQFLTVAEEAGPEAGSFRVELAGPNPFRQSTTVRVIRPTAGPLRVVVLDGLGREVARLVDGAEAAEVTVPFVAAGLASGVYRVVAESEGQRASQGVTVVR